MAPAETTRRNWTTGQLEYFRAFSDGTQGWATTGYVPGGSAASRTGSASPRVGNSARYTTPDGIVIAQFPEEIEERFTPVAANNLFSRTFGMGFGIGGGQQGSQSSSSGSFCAQFVEKIVSAFKAYQEKWAILKPKYRGEQVRTDIGFALVWNSFSSPYKFVDGTSVNYADPSQLTGFKRDLVASPQEHDAFRHIQATAGFYVLGGVWKLLAYGMTAKDALDMGRKYNKGDIAGALEDGIAIKNDEAGRQVGRAINAAARHFDSDGFSNRLTSILCEPRR